MSSSSRFPRPLAIALVALVEGAAFVGGAHAASASFQALDADRDGGLTRAELQGHPHLLRRFDAIDADHDGRITNVELQAWHAARLRRAGSEGQAFTRLDLNGDGIVDRSELPDSPTARAWFEAADTNHDGVVTKEEARAWLAGRRTAAAGTGGPPHLAVAAPR